MAQVSLCPKFCSCRFAVRPAAAAAAAAAAGGLGAYLPAQHPARLLCAGAEQSVAGHEGRCGAAWHRSVLRMDGWVYVQGAAAVGVCSSNHGLATRALRRARGAGRR
jgi:hypothetical protein